MLKFKSMCFYSLGHGSVIINPSGEYWFAYHAYRWKQVGKDPGRVLCLDRITWNETRAWPYIGIPSNKPSLAPNVFLN